MKESVFSVTESVTISWKSLLLLYRLHREYVVYRFHREWSGAALLWNKVCTTRVVLTVST